MTRTMPALTIWQPWATLIAEGLKPYEFRSWPPPSHLIGRRIGIHAGARPVRVGEVNDLRCRMAANNWRTTGLIEPGKVMDLLDRVWHEPRGLPLSSVICTAIVGQPIRDHALAAALGIDLANDSDRDEHSNWAWPLHEIERLEPFVPARGLQGLWTWRRGA
jgi:ASCH domain